MYNISMRKEIREEQFNIFDNQTTVKTVKKDMKLYIRSIQGTNKFIEELPSSESLVIMNLGQALTILSGDVLEYDYMINDIYTNEDIKDTLIKKVTKIVEQSKVILEESKFDHFIIRCDAGASRSQALGTALTNYYSNITFDRNILDGNMLLLQLFEKELGILRSEETYAQMIYKRWEEITGSEDYRAVFLDYDDSTPLDLCNFLLRYKEK